MQDRDPFADEAFTEEEQKAFDQMSAELKGEPPTPDLAQTADQPPPSKPEQSPEGKQSPAKVDADEDDHSTITLDEKGYARDQVTGKFVPHKRFNQVWQEHKATKAELAALKEEHARADERLKVLMQAFEGEKKPEAPAGEAPKETQYIDPEHDFLGAVKQMQEMQRAFKAQQSEQQQRYQQEQQERQLGERWQRDLHAYGQSEPQFQAAVKHLLTIRDAVLQTEGVSDLAQRQAIMQQEERNLVQRAYAEGANPAERVYSIAKAYGFRPPEAAAPAPATNGAANPEGFPAPSAAAQKIAQVSQNMQRAGGSLSNAHGTGGDAISAAQLANMTEEDHLELMNKLGERAYEMRFLGRER